jgi:hypothetical protein
MVIKFVLFGTYSFAFVVSVGTVVWLSGSISDEAVFLSLSYEALVAPDVAVIFGNFVTKLDSSSKFDFLSRVILWKKLFMMRRYSKIKRV